MKKKLRLEENKTRLIIREISIRLFFSIRGLLDNSGKQMRRNATKLRRGANRTACVLLLFLVLKKEEGPGHFPRLPQCEHVPAQMDSD